MAVGYISSRLILYYISPSPSVFIWLFSNLRRHPSPYAMWKILNPMGIKFKTKVKGIWSYSIIKYRRNVICQDYYHFDHFLDLGF